MTGIWTLGLGIIIREGEEGVVVEIDNLIGVEEVVVREHRNIHNKDASRSHSGVAPTTTPPAQRLRAVSFIHTVSSRTTEALSGNGVTARR